MQPCKLSNSILKSSYETIQPARCDENIPVNKHIYFVLLPVGTALVITLEYKGNYFLKLLVGSLHSKQKLLFESRLYVFFVQFL
jgi:hypothetical protein